MSEQPVVTSPPPSETAHGQPVVVAKDVTRRYGEGRRDRRRAPRRLGASSRRGQFTAIMGPSGSGKSTLMHCLAGLDTADQRARSRSTAPRSPALRRRGAHAAAPRPDRVRLPVLQPAADADGRGEHRAAAVARRAQARPGVGSTQLLAAVGLGDRRTHRPSELSGGQQQRVAVARALRQPARPSSSPTSRPATSTPRRAPRSSSSCAASADEFGQTIVMVTHDPRAAAIADRVVFLADGLIVARRGPARPPTRSSTR